MEALVREGAGFARREGGRGGGRPPVVWRAAIAAERLAMVASSWAISEVGGKGIVGAETARIDAGWGLRDCRWAKMSAKRSEVKATGMGEGESLMEGAEGGKGEAGSGRVDEGKGAGEARTVSATDGWDREVK